jgi:hypothetical protein
MAELYRVFYIGQFNVSIIRSYNLISMTLGESNVGNPAVESKVAFPAKVCCSRFSNIHFPIMRLTEFYLRQQTMTPQIWHQEVLWR